MSSANIAGYFKPAAAVEDVLVVKCQLCQKPVLETAFKRHLDSCMSRHPHAYLQLAPEGTPMPSPLASPVAPLVPALPKPPTTASTAAAPARPLKGGDAKGKSGPADGADESAAAAAAATAASMPPPAIDLTGPDADGSGDVLDPPSSSAFSTLAGPDGVAAAPAKPAPKKRKAPATKADAADKPTKKAKTAADSAASTPKTKKKDGPMDFDKQCGVLMPNGEPCRRSITCKNHSVGSKRLVPGRSQPYDTLYELFQGSKRVLAQSTKQPGLPEADDQVPLPDLSPDDEGAVMLEGIKKIAPTPLATRGPVWCSARPLVGMLETLLDAIKAAR
ncbi:SAGA complex subunit Sgf73 [Blastocladiella emersonii ATCC 22665]|nr:SAGA complex subunit Sgf73 [Blastocladiella emersonii ATCC 22665]